MSSFIHDRNPIKYGAQQDDFVKRSSVIVSLGARKISLALEKKESLTQLFFKLLNFFSQQRQIIAQQHGTRDAKDFGKKRTSPDVFMFSFTGLASREYFPYAKRICKILKASLQMTEDLSKKTDFFSDSQMDLEVYDWKKFEEKGLLDHRGELIIPPKTKEKLLDPIHLTNSFDRCNLEEKSRYNKQLEHLRKNDPRFYNHFWTCQVLDNFLERSTTYVTEAQLLEIMPGFTDLCKTVNDTMGISFVNSYFLHVKIREPIGTTNFTIFEYLALTKVHPAKSPDFIVTIIHMDKFDVDSALTNITALFEKIILTPPDSKEFLPLMGQFRRAMSVIMPLVRGSAAVEEWFERSLFKVKAFEITYHDSCNVNLESYAQPDRSQFVNDYANQKFFKLQKKS